MSGKKSQAPELTVEEGQIHIGGIQAIVRVALDQIRSDRRRNLKTGMFISGYRGSPLGGLDQAVERQTPLLKANDIYFNNGINEDLAATAVWGTQMMHVLPKSNFDGVLGMWYGKAPGVDRSGDALKHANYTGVQKNGGVLAVVGDDPSCKSSSLPSQSEPMLYHVGIPSLYPGNVQDVLDLGLHGYALSRASGLWAGLKIVTNVADGSGHAVVSPDRINPVIPELEVSGRPFVPQMNLGMNVRDDALDMEFTLYNARLEMTRRYARANKLNRVTVPNADAWLGIVTAGKTYHDVRQAFMEMGLDDDALRTYGIRVMKLGMLFPLEPNDIREFAQGLEEIVVIEEKRPFVELFVKDILYGRANAPRIVGKFDEEQQPLLPGHGEFEPDIIGRALLRRISRRARIESADNWLKRLDEVQVPKLATVPRSAWYCSGCPHNMSTKAPDSSVVSAGIGCHTMAMWVHGNTVMGTHMGAEGAQWIGMAPFTDTQHIFQNLGDGTYFHSGILAIKYAASSGVNITYKLLYNSHVSMTGGQEAMGAKPVPDVVSELLSVGVKRVIVTTEDLSRYEGVNLSGGTEVWHRDRSIEAQTLLAGTKGTTVLLHDQECAAELRRLRGRGQRPDPATRVIINERVCEGCGDCGVKSNCMSVEPVQTEFGRKTKIHQSSCNKDYSCVKGFCPSFLSITPGGEAAAAPAKKERRLPPLERDLPLPAFKVPQAEFGVHVMGIGGTGTVTVAQIIAQAAILDGKFAYGMDQTGLAQKGGAVISDIKVTSMPFEGAAKISDASSDLYLGFDILNATDSKNLAKCHPGRTVAVVSTTQTPTGRMVANKNVLFPESSMLTRGIDRVTRKEDNVYLNGQTLAEGLFGDSMATNMFMVGVAFQSGALPIAAKAIEQAIQKAGVAVEMGLLAFKWGRMAVVDESFVRAEIAKSAVSTPLAKPAARVLDPQARALVDSVGASGETLRLLETRIPELIAYQDPAYAKRYAESVKRVIQTEREKLQGRTELSEAVARNLYKLMAYKDEYEVARLQTDPEFLAMLEREFKPGYKVTYHLAPPAISRRDPVTGHLVKRQFGGWMLFAFRLMARLKFLRGTALDLFGKTPERRQERQLIADYEQLIERICSGLNRGNHGVAVELAKVPDLIRGYGHVKEQSIVAAKAKEQDLLVALTRPQPEIERVAA